jgi:hypothetical protein
MSSLTINPNFSPSLWEKWSVDAQFLFSRNKKKLRHFYNQEKNQTAPNF